MAQPEVIKDIEARVKKSGDTMTGNLMGKYLQGTWLQTTSASDLGSSPSKIAVISPEGWIYYRTPSELASDIGLTGNYLPKTTYEYNKELAFGQSGKLCIGKFPMYDSNITITINSTTDTAFHGTLVIATQNINTSGGGTKTLTVYDDPTGSLANSIYVHYGSGSNIFSVYANFPPWSKNLLHIQCVALAGTPTDIATSVDSIPSNATLRPTNALTSATNTWAMSTTGNAATATKLGTATVGSSVKPIYLNAGTATASTSTIGSSTKPIYMSNGTITACGNSLNVSITGSALTMKIKRVSEQITTIAAKVAIGTEAVYFCSSDGITFGCPQTYCIINIKKGDNHRTIMDCYHLNTGDHYINGCMMANGTNDAWTGWILQPNPSQITNLQVAVDGKLAKTDGYAGSSSAGGSANSAVKLDTTTAGDSNTPVYFSEGKPVACTSLGLNTSGNAASASKVNNKLTVGSKTFDGSTAVTINAGDLGLASAMLFLGTTTTAIKDGATTNPITIGGESKTVTAGNVVLYNNKEFVWTGSIWELLGDEGSYKVKQTAVTDPTASGTALAFIDSISQDINGNITATKKTVAVTNNAPTLSWGTTSTIGTVAGTNLQVTMPDNPNTDTKVTQTMTTSNTTYPLLLAPNGQVDTTTTSAYFDSGVTLNPSTNTITANISGNANTAKSVPSALNSNGTTSTTELGYTYGVGGFKQQISNSSSGGYKIQARFAKWYVNLNTGITTLEDGMLISIKIPVPGYSYGTCISIDGTYFHPVVYNSNNGISTMYPVGTKLLLMYDSSSASAVWGSNTGGIASSSGTITGVWRVMNTFNSDTWVVNSATTNGYVTSGSGKVNKVWKTDANGNPAWRDDDNTTDYNALTNKPSINGKQLNENTTLSADDVGALASQEGLEGQILGFISDNVVGAIDIPEVVAVWG